MIFNLRQPSEIIATALRVCRRHFLSAALFSALLNLLFIAPMLYMLQIYDRVVPTQGEVTLLFLTMVVLFALITLSLLDFVRSRLLVRASVRLDRHIAGGLLDTTLALRRHTGEAMGKQALREFDTLRQAQAATQAQIEYARRHIEESRELLARANAMLSRAFRP